MKKRVLLIAAIAVGVLTAENAKAQDFKPEAGAKNIEVNFSPFGDDPININSIRLRFFTSSNFALRVGVHINSTKEEDPEGLTFDYNPQSQISEYELSEFEFGINVGFEKHWSGTERLSPYWGFEFGYGSVSSTQKYKQTIRQQFSEQTREVEISGGRTSIGANILIGADYYFVPKFYFGTEIGFGFVSTAEKDIEFKSNNVPSEGVEGPSSFEVGENINSAIRVGFIF